MVFATASTRSSCVVLTVPTDRERRGEGPASAEEIAAGTAWPGEKPYGVARTRRILRALLDAGLVQRTATRAYGVRWEVPR